MTNQPETGGDLGEVLEGQDVMISWPETGRGCTASQTLLAGTVQMVVDKVRELDSGDALRREKLASMITMDGVTLSGSEECPIPQ